MRFPLGLAMSVPHRRLRTKGWSWRPGERIGWAFPTFIAAHRVLPRRMLNLVPVGRRSLYPILAADSVWWRCRRPTVIHHVRCSLRQTRDPSEQTSVQLAAAR
jgi:hypothetical protein